MIRGTARTCAKGLLRRLRCDIGVRREAGALHVVVRHRRVQAPHHRSESIAELFDEPDEALHHLHGGKPAAFACLLDQCRDVNGLGFGDDGWHPLSATLHEYARGEIDGYDGSSLQRYYQRFQPQNLQEAFIGLDPQADGYLRDLPSHLIYWFPWSAKTAAEADETILNNFYHDNVEHGRPDMTVAEHGSQSHGPVSEVYGQLQYERLVQVFESLRTEGYRREFGDTGGMVVRREGQLRYLVSGGGLHRVAAMQILGARTIPATFSAPTVFDAAQVDRWPQVRRGAWSRETALRYVDHLFDFDAYAWARRNGLLEHDRESAAPHGAQPAAVAPTGTDAQL